MAVACGGGERGGGGGERQRAAKAAAAACSSGMRLFSVTRDGTLRGEMKIHVKDMSGHKFAERGGGRSANLCFYDRHAYNRVKNRVKKI